MYEDVIKLLLGSEEERQLIVDFEFFLFFYIFFDKVMFILKYDGDVFYIKIGNKFQLEIYNLGDGF